MSLFAPISSRKETNRSANLKGISQKYRASSVFDITFCLVHNFVCLKWEGLNLKRSVQFRNSKRKYLNFIWIFMSRIFSKLA